jgi:DNA-binding NarL/FixJ family response regulator
MKLGPRERQLVVGLASSKTMKEIAFEWGRSIKTVEWYRASIYRKLGIGDLQALTRYAMRRRLVK